MRLFHQFIFRLRALFARKRFEAEMSEELRTHLAMQTEANLAARMSPEEARRAALLACGGIDQAQEAWRDQRGWVWLEQFWQDVRVAVRALARRPAFAGAAVATFALGLALVTLQFSFINGTLLNGLPFPRADQLFRIDGPKDDDPYPLSQRAFLEWRTLQRSFDGLGAYTRDDANLSAPGLDARRYRGAAFSADLLSVLGIHPILGRGFHSDDERPDAPRVVLLGEDVWNRDFGGDRAAVGRSVRLNGETATIVGVLPSGFAFPNSQQLWTNLRTPAEKDRLVWLLGRLREGVSAGTAHAELQTLLSASAAADEKKPGLRVWRLRDWAGDGGFKLTLLLMLALAGGALLLAAVNAANLLLLRAIRRVPELALRAALGARRGRLMRQMVVEAVLLAVGGAMLAGALAAWIAPLINRQLHADGMMPFWIRIQMDHRIFGACLLLALGLGALCGLAPAWRITRFRSLTRLGESAQSTAGLATGRLTRMIVTLQLGLACALLLVTAMFVKAGRQIGQVDLRFDAAGTLGAMLTLEGSRDLRDTAARVHFGAELRARLRALPAVVGVTFSSRHPADQGMGGPVEAEGHPAAGWDDAAWAFQETVAPGYFQALGIPLQAGRDFSEAEGGSAGPEVIVVNEALARRLWPDEPALGQRLRDLPTAPGRPTSWLTVVGVAPDLPLRGALNPKLTPGYYVPYGQRTQGQMAVLVRTAGKPSLLTKPLRETVRALAPDVPVEGIQSVEGRIADRFGFLRSIGLLALTFGLGALFLAATGIYSTVAFGVRQRTREFGVRFALGATRRDILLLLWRQTSAQLLIGLGGGLALGWAASRLIGHGRVRLVETLDYPYGAIVIAMVVLATFLALWLPVRSAAKVDPVEALRTE